MRATITLLRVGRINYVRGHPFLMRDELGIVAWWEPSALSKGSLLNTRHFDDPFLLRYCGQVLRPGMMVFDVGLHLGAFSSFAGRLVAPDGCIHAFEPTKDSLERASRNLDANDLRLKCLKLSELAVYSYTGTVRFTTYAPRYSAWNTTSTQPNMGVEPECVVEAECTTIDDYCRSNDVDFIDLLKIDVEGAEVEVLHGAERMISEGRIAAIVFEISMQPLAALHRAPDDVISAFVDQAFEVFRIGRGGRLYQVNAQNVSSLPPFANYAAIPQGSEHWEPQGEADAVASKQAPSVPGAVPTTGFLFTDTRAGAGAA